MGLLPSRSVEIWISNNTQNITLQNPRIYSDSNHSSASSKPELSPGSCHFWHFQSSSWFCDVTGILVYEAESFTLTIHFSNPIDYKEFPMKLNVTVSPRTAHLGSLEDVLTRMAKGTYYRSHLQTKFDSIVVDKNHRTAQVSNGPVKVTATMSYATASVLEVVLEEQEESWEEVGIQNTLLGKIGKLHSLKTRCQEK